MAIKFWLKKLEDTIQCPACNSTFPSPSDERVLTVCCPRCQQILHNESQILEELIHTYSSVYENSGVVYDDTVEMVLHFLNSHSYLRRKATLLIESFEALSAEILGEDYYIVDPVNGLSAIEIMTRDMLKCLGKRKRKWFTKNTKNKR